VDTERLREAMGRAIELARSHRPHPNPRVGAVLLDPEGRLISEGAHVAPGRPHAEVVALSAAGSRSRGATMVVTLEPCAHTGRTPPCVDAIVGAGVVRVVVGAVDPDPRVSGAGIRRLRDAGIEVVEHVLSAECEDLDPAYFHHRRTGRPLLTLKTASTLDGQTAAADGTSQWITGPAARRDAHRLRAAADAVVVGAGTLRADDPRLTVRLDGYRGPQPVPVVVAGSAPLPERARLWERDPIIVATEPRERGRTIVVPAGPDGLPDLEAAVRALAAEGLLDLLIEGGPTLAGALWRRGLIDRGVTYLAARIAGGEGRGIFGGVFSTLGDARAIRLRDVRRVGDDLRVAWVVDEGAFPIA